MTNKWSIDFASLDPSRWEEVKPNCYNFENKSF